MDLTSTKPQHSDLFMQIIIFYRSEEKSERKTGDISSKGKSRMLGGQDVPFGNQNFQGKKWKNKAASQEKD